MLSCLIFVLPVPGFSRKLTLSVLILPKRFRIVLSGIVRSSWGTGVNVGVGSAVGSAVTTGVSVIIVSGTECSVGIDSAADGIPVSGFPGNSGDGSDVGRIASAGEGVAVYSGIHPYCSFLLASSHDGSMSRYFVITYPSVLSIRTYVHASYAPDDSFTYCLFSIR